MPRMDILSAVEREEFDAPPTLTFAQQQRYFDPPLEVIHLLKRLKTPTNQVFFLISYGYFLAAHRFYSCLQFREADIDYVTQALGWSSDLLQPSSYAKQTQARHRHLILNLCQFRAWNHVVLQMLTSETQTLAQLYWEPRHIFMRLVERLIATRVTVPHSDVLSRLVATELTQHRQTIAQQVGSVHGNGRKVPRNCG